MGKVVLDEHLFQCPIPFCRKRWLEAELVLLGGFHCRHMMMVFLAVQQKELEDRGMGEQKAAESIQGELSKCSQLPIS